MKRVLLGSDHAGITLKLAIKKHLQSLQFEVVDVGTYKNQSCHYPDYAQKMSQIIKPEDKGILVCGSGIGIGIAANKFGMKCGEAFNQYTAKQCAKHFQVMSVGERIVPFEIVKEMLKQFLGLEKKQ